MTISLDDAKSVAYLYEASLNRQADLGGLNFWIDVVESSGFSLPQLAQSFLDSNEYAQNFGDPDEQSNEEFVEILYNNILGRVSDPAGFDFWTGVLENGTPKNEVLLLFAIATENKAASPYIDTLSEGLGGNYYFASDGKGEPDIVFDDHEGKVGIETISVASDVVVQTNESAGIINLDDFLADPEFDGIDGHGMTTVIIDTGIDLNHPAFGPDLDGNGISDRIVYSQDFTQDGDGTADDVQGHGSNVASIVAGSDPNFEGMAPAANIIALQGLGNDGSGDFGWIEKALQWVVENAVAYNIVSVNMSLGDSTNVAVPGPNPTGLADELAALNSLGVITVAAAGNSYFDYQTEGASSLAADPNVIAVGAVWDGAFGKVTFQSGAEDTTTGVDRITSFSQRSTALPTIFAPGAFIEGAAPGGGTVSMAGTSQAAPHIAGIAVLAQQLAEQELGRRLTPDEFAQLLFDTGDTIFDGDDEQDNVVNTNANYRRVDVYALATAIVELGGGGGTNPPPSDIAGDASTGANLAIGASAGSDLGFALDSDWFRINLEAGHAYDFALLGAALGNGTLVDPYLRLRDGFGNIVAYDDDSGSGLDSLIDDFVPTAGGTYYLDAGAYSSGTGTYSIATSTSGAQSNEIAENTGTNANLAVGNSLVSTLDFDNDHDWVRVQLIAGETYQIDLQGAPSGAGTIADPYLYVLDANGNPVAANDDGGVGFDSQLFFTPSASGTYYLSAGSFRTSDIGTYELSITELNAGDIPGSTATFAELQPDQSTTSDLGYLGDTDWFAFYAYAGERFQIDLDGAGGNPLSDPLLRIYDSNGFQVGYDDDSGPGLNSSFAFNVQSEGWYYLSAEAYGNSRTGGYEISVTSTGFDVPDGFATSVQIQPGQSFVSTIDFAGDHDWYILDVQAGSEYEIFLEGTGEAGELSDPLLRIYDQNGFQVAANDDSGGTRDSFIDFFAEFDERLYLSAEAYANSGTGDYFITVV
jgi:subtilisin family serine protease